MIADANKRPGDQNPFNNVTDSPDVVPRERPSRPPVGVGIIGLGTRGVHAIAKNMADLWPETGLEIVALCDRSPARMNEARDALRARYDDAGCPIDPSLHRDGKDLIANPTVDLVVVTSITDTHREFVVPALRAGKRVYCDKPLAHNVTDSIAIVEAETETDNPLIMGFTRRYEAAWRRAHELVADGAIGRLVMMQVRDVIPYHRYLTAWWRRREWSGGALNDKGSHLFDVFNWFAESQVVSVSGLGGASMIEPDPTAPARCHQCSRDCPFRRRSEITNAPVGEEFTAHDGPSWLDETDEKYIDDVCVYAPGADIYHNGNIQFSYANGIIASYFYTIFGPPSADEETFELVGTTGRIILTRSTGSLDVLSDRGNTHNTVTCRDEHFEGTHFGADAALVRELRRFSDGAAPTVSARAGLEATRMVEAALTSMDRNGTQLHMTELPNARV